MASIKNVKVLISQEEASKIKNILAPYRELSEYFDGLINVISALEEEKPIEEKPIRRKRSTTKEEKSESKDV